MNWEKIGQIGEGLEAVFDGDRVQVRHTQTYLVYFFTREAMQAALDMLPEGTGSWVNIGAGLEVSLRSLVLRKHGDPKGISISRVALEQAAALFPSLS
jgi:hypothetical protein